MDDHNEQDNEAPVEAQDFNVLLHAILRQAIDDYIKLQHPRFRTKKYLQEAFDSAVNMLFDSEFRFLYLKTPYENEMSLKDLVSHLLDDNRMDMDKLKEHVLDEARTFWETKLVRTLYIPDTFIYDAHVYKIEHTEDPDPSVDYDKKIVKINKRQDSENELQFMYIVLKILFYHEEIAFTEAKFEQLGKALFRMLKVNSCFVGH